jgi:HK97 family phage portal protein
MIKMKRIVGKNKINFLKTYNKSATGYISDNMQNEYVTPTLIKLCDEDALKIYKYSEWVNAVVNRIVTDVCKIKPVVVLKDKTKKLKPKHKAQIDWIENTFFENVNDNGESFNSLRIKILKNLLVLGRIFVERTYNKNFLKELYVINPSTMSIKIDEHGMMMDKNLFKQDFNGKIQYFSKEQMIFKTLSPSSDDVYGEKYLDALANTVASDILRSTYNSKYFINGAEANGIIGLEGMNKNELRQFKQYWRDNHKGANNAHKMLAVNVPIKYIRMALTNRDMEFTEYGKELRTKIFAVFKMQPFIMGIVDDNTGKLNSEKQYEVYKDGALRPLLQTELEIYNKEILHYGFGFTDLKIKFEGIDLLDEETQTRIDAVNLGNGSITINEVRAQRGLPEVPWGNTPLSMAPGGGQVDPETGRVVNVNDNTDNNETNNDENNNEEDNEEKD